MKKFLLFFCLILSAGAFNCLYAQCQVTGIVITKFDTAQIPNTNDLSVTIDVQFTTTTNGGNKNVFFHVWKEGQYPQTLLHGGTKPPFTCTPGANQSVGPYPSTFSGANNLDVLDNAFLNFGFNVNEITAGITPLATGITQTYAGDGAVDLNWEGATIRKENIGTDIDRIFIENLSFIIPDQAAGQLIQVRPFNWATNGTGGKPQCWGCSASFVFGDPKVSGQTNCSNIDANGKPYRTYTIIIDSKYDLVSTAGTDFITGKYTLHLDVDGNQEVNTGDILVKDSTDFVTGNVPAIPGFTSRYLGADLSFNNSYPPLGAPYSSAQVIAVVKVSTPGYTGGATAGLFANPCANLPVSLKSFNATQRSNKAFLTWETDLENNNDGFEIERRSAGNSQYQKIGFVDSKAPGGTGSAFTYSFDDNQSLAKGVTYYRLRQVDLDGKATYSEVKAVRTGNGGLLTISIYPNPNRGAANVTIPESAGKMDVSLDDYTGKSIQRWSGISVRNLQLNNMRPGIYMLRINFRETGETITERIIVQ
jgi:hypothetical protein